MNRLNTYQWLAKFLQKIGVKKKTEKEKEQPKEIRYIDRKDRYVWFVLIIGFLLALLSVKSCNLVKNMVCDCDRSIPSGKETVRIDTVELPAPPPDTVEIEKPVPYKVEVPDPALLAKIDSLERTNSFKDIVIDYYQKRSYDRILKDDSIAFVRVKDVVTENQLQEGELIFELRQKPQRITTTITTEKELRFRLFAGGFIGGNKTGSFEAGLSLMAVPKNDNFYVQYSYDAVSSSHRAGIGWKIRFKAP